MFLTPGVTVTVTRSAVGSGPAIQPRWMRPATLTEQVEWFLVAASLWVIPIPRWVSAADFDTASEIPQAEVDPSDIRRFWPEQPAWHEHALCATPEAKRIREELDPLFFGVDDLERPALPPSAVAAAREVCDGCTVRVECLFSALENDERFGIWAGTTGRQRSKMRASLRTGAIDIDMLVKIYA